MTMKKNGTASRPATRVSRKSASGEREASGEVWMATTSSAAVRRKASSAAKDFFCMEMPPMNAGGWFEGSDRRERDLRRLGRELRERAEF